MEKWVTWVAVCLGGSFVLLAIGAAIIEGTVSTSAPVTAFIILAGMALLIIGFGEFGSNWKVKDPTKFPDIPAQWSVILTIVSTIIALFAALWAYAAKDVIWTVVCVGALGGLAHEIVQSKGTSFLPDTQSSGQNAGKKDNSGSQENYLGGLLGLILGGAAGLLTLSATSATSGVSTELVVTAFSAGVALKGISDAAASPSKSSNGGNNPGQGTSTTTPP